MALDAQATLTAARSEIANADLKELERLRVRYLGKKGMVTAGLKALGQLPESEKRTTGRQLNQLRRELTEIMKARRETLELHAAKQRVSRERLDVTLPGRRRYKGSLHPVTITLRRVRRFFAAIGFAEESGPEIEDDFHNFAALNIPERHPARAMHDTFYFGDGRLLRTHTSPVQIRAMRRRPPPLRIIAPGRVYRCDADATHSMMFHQVEGLRVDAQVSFAELKGVVTDFVHAFFADEKLKIRFRPSYFPFTEPSAEVDILYRADNGEKRWLEVMGCGMVHPNVLTAVDYDPGRYSGYAFGMGIERLAMLRYGVPDLRRFFANDMQFLEQFSARI